MSRKRGRSIAADEAPLPVPVAERPAADQMTDVVVVGSDFTDVAVPTELGFNARIAANLNIPVMLIVGGRQHDGQETLGQSAPRSAREIAQAIREMSLLGQKLGAKPETAYDLPGVGDLEVTGLSGRNKVYGVRIGRGEKPTEALEEMKRLEQTVEGVPATGLAMILVSQRAADITDQLPLLLAINEILQGNVEDVLGAVAQAVLPARP